jgi:hypothetical protein
MAPQAPEPAMTATTSTATQRSTSINTNQPPWCCPGLTDT